MSDEKREIVEYLDKILEIALKIAREQENLMGTPDALAGLKAQMAQLQTDVATQQATDTLILADVKKLLAGATPLPNGQVAVSAADIAALVTSAQTLDASVVAETAGDVAADKTVNP